MLDGGKAVFQNQGAQRLDTLVGSFGEVFEEAYPAAWSFHGGNWIENILHLIDDIIKSILTE